ncbi:hypothetical protein BJ508DRAFT_169025 [Ascobolus immersus RN42]|uniref:Uncharacterized protein n=1 Tax=Ascobolus immersus RN42 TaxID=1160509 RepID=A0A3N4IIB7_ASCIM|nr:hypothetical protein BJ508DRAFT_169025 [Ascobolus immersus RN42]
MQNSPLDFTSRLSEHSGRIFIKDIGLSAERSISSGAISFISDILEILYFIDDKSTIIPSVPDLPRSIVNFTTRYLFYYVDKLHPCLSTLETVCDYLRLQNTGDLAELHESSHGRKLAGYYTITHHFLAAVGPYTLRNLRKRARSGLLREKQVDLILLVQKGILETMEYLCNCFWEIGITSPADLMNSDGSIEKAQTEKLGIWVEYVNNHLPLSHLMIRIFLVSEEFRSERLETLIWKYVDQDSGEAGKTVARQVEEISIHTRT